MWCVLKADSVSSENGNVSVESAHSAGRASWRHKSARELGEPTSGVAVGGWKEGKRAGGGRPSARRPTKKKREGNPVTERFNPVTQRRVTWDVGRRSGEGICVAFSKLIEQQRSGNVNTAAVSIES